MQRCRPGKKGEQKSGANIVTPVVSAFETDNRKALLKPPSPTVLSTTVLVRLAWKCGTSGSAVSVSRGGSLLKDFVKLDHEPQTCNPASRFLRVQPDPISSTFA
jgi:hypothetical protein